MNLVIFSVFFLDHVIFLRTGCFFFGFFPLQSHDVMWQKNNPEQVRKCRLMYPTKSKCLNLNAHLRCPSVRSICLKHTKYKRKSSRPKLSFIFLDFLSWRDDNFHVEPNGCVAFSVFALCLFHYGNWSDMLQFLDVTWPVVQPLMCMNIPLILYRCVWTLLGIVFCIVIHGYNVFAQFPAFQSMCAVAESRWFQQDVIVVAARRQ